MLINLRQFDNYMLTLVIKSCMSFMKDQNYDETLDLLHNLDSASTNHGMVKRNESQLRQWCKFASFHLEHSGSINEKNFRKIFTNSILKNFRLTNDSLNLFTLQDCLDLDTCI